MTREEILQRLEEIEARAEKATPGRWKWSSGFLIALREGCNELVLLTDWDRQIHGRKEEDEGFIAHAREDVPWLCQIVRQLVGRLNKLEAVAGAARGVVSNITVEERKQMRLDLSYQVQRLEEALAALEEDGDD